MNIDSFYENLAGIIKYHRKKSGLTQSELAELANVGKTAVFDIEHKKRTVQLNTLLSILRILNISIDFSSPLMNYY
ncbi:MAG: helix-turn-helix domain-containing protein, partial [Candidatus Omnitrophota bacterium]